MSSADGLFWSGALFFLALSVLAQALAGSFFWIAVWSTVGGGCSGAFMGVVFAEVSGRVPDSQRGRALGWVMSGQSLTLVIGVPMAAAVGSLIGWRGWLICVGGLAFAASLSLFAAVGRGTAGHMRGGVRPSLRTALSPKVLGLLGTGIAERICYGLAAVYFATFLQATYHLSLVETAIPLAVFALGNVAGTILGGQLADRLRDRLLTFAVAMALSGVAALALFMWHPNLAISVALGFVYVFLNALGRPSYMASLASGARRSTRHGAGAQRHHGQRRLDRRRGAGRGHDRLGRFRRVRSAGGSPGLRRHGGRAAQPPEGVMSDTTLRGRLRESDMWWSFRHSPLTIAAAIVTLLFFLGAIFAPWVAPFDPFDVKSLNLMDAFTPPAWNENGSVRHLLGTDNQGRDVLSAILYGSRVSLVIGLAAIVLSVTTGVLLGLSAGFRGGWVEAVVMRLADIQLTVPAILIALTLDGVARVVLPRGVHDDIAIWVLVLSIGVAYWPQFARVTRATTLAEKNKDYVNAARIIGLPGARIALAHVLPNAWGPVLVIATIELALAIIAEASLSYLGVGMPATQPSLGTLIRIGNAFLFSGEWWIVIFPALALVILSLAVNLLGDWLRDALNPKLR